MTFIPEWAEAALKKPEPFDLAELQVLREFYDAWFLYHTIPNEKKNRGKQRDAANLMLEKHNLIEQMRSPKLIGTAMFNGEKLEH